MCTLFEEEEGLETWAKTRTEGGLECQLKCSSCRENGRGI